MKVQSFSCDIGCMSSLTRGTIDKGIFFSITPYPIFSPNFWTRSKTWMFAGLGHRHPSAQSNTTVRSMNQSNRSKLQQKIDSKQDRPHKSIQPPSNPHCTVTTIRYSETRRVVNYHTRYRIPYLGVTCF